MGAVPLNKTLELFRPSLPELQAIIGLNAAKGSDLATMALQEIEFYRMQLQFTPSLAGCDPQSVIMAIKSVLKKNLSLDPTAGLVYMKTRNVNVGTRDSPTWLKALEITETANGLISYNRQCGRILDVDRPEVKKDEKGKVISVTAKFLVPSFNEAGKAVTRWKTIEFDESDFMRWRRASHKENKRNSKDGVNDETLNKANENYTNWMGGIDPEFSRSKAIKHGLKKLGTNPHEINYKKLAVTEDINHEVIIDIKKDLEAAADDAIVMESYQEDNAATEQQSDNTHVFDTKETSTENNIANLETLEL